MLQDEVKQEREEKQEKGKKQKKKTKNKKRKLKKNDNFETWAFNFFDENKKIQKALNKKSSVSLDLNHLEIRGDGNQNIMLAKKQYRVSEKNFR